MGSDYAMNPPIPVTKREVIYYVAEDSRQRALDRLAQLVEQGKSFKVTPLSDQLVILVYTGEWL